ncbi:MAG: AsmA family protein [Pseudomonadota bacterium]
MRTLRYVLLGVAGILLVASAVLAVFLDDANRFKPRLEALIESTTGVAVRIGGELRWKLWPPVSIAADRVSAEQDGQAWDVGRLTVNLALMELLTGPDAWRVASFTATDAVLRDDAGRLEIHRARLRELAPQRPAPFSAELTYTADGLPPRPLTLDGFIALDPDTGSLGLTDTRFETVDAAGLCHADARALEDAAPAPPAAEDELIPVATLRAFDVDGTCSLDWVAVEDRRFTDVDVVFSSEAGDARLALDAPDVFGGEAAAVITADARREPVQWTVEPDLAGVDSAALLALFDQRLTWAAPLAYGGTLRFEGNTPEAIRDSVSGETRFDGGQGRIDISAIKGRLVELAAMFNEGERIRAWPQMWRYQRFVGDWRIDGRHHMLNVALDNLSISAEGDYAPFRDDMDMLLELVFSDDPEWPVFEMNPALYDLPIPIRCRGELTSPRCRLDEDAAQRIVARAVSGEDSELRAELENKIDQEVPAQYRDAARSLLDALGGSSGRRGGEQ